jgi:hypothetical protein
MTDLEWDDSADPSAMICFVAQYERACWVGRKLRLFAAACCRAVWPHMPDWRSREAVEEAERVVSRAVRRSRLAALRDIAEDVWSIGPNVNFYWYDEFPREARVPRRDLSPDAVAAGRAAAACADADDPVRAATETVAALGPLVGPPELAGLLREVCGNPYRRAAARRWWSQDVRALARTIEDERAFARLPILGDALMDAGCDDEEVIRRCRCAAPHALGCWVVDLALGRD